MGTSFVYFISQRVLTEKVSLGDALQGWKVLDTRLKKNGGVFVFFCLQERVAVFQRMMQNFFRHMSARDDTLACSKLPTPYFQQILLLIATGTARKSVKLSIIKANICISIEKAAVLELQRRAVLRLMTKIHASDYLGERGEFGPCIFLSWFDFAFIRFSILFTIFHYALCCCGSTRATLETHTQLTQGK